MRSCLLLQAELQLAGRCGRNSKSVPVAVWKWLAAFNRSNEEHPEVSVSQ